MRRLRWLSLPHPVLWTQFPPEARRHPNHLVMDSKERSHGPGQQTVLVLGCPRSGTTLLAAMLSTHTQIALTSEVDLRFANRILSKRFVGTKLTVPVQIELTRKATRVEYVLGRLPGLFRLRRLFRRPVRTVSIQDYLEDRPIVIGIVRDPEATIASNERRGGTSRSEAERRWVVSLNALSWLRRNYSRSYVVRYEDLLSAPETTLRGLLTWMGLQFEPAILDGYAHTPQYPGRQGITSGTVRLETEWDHPIFDDPSVADKYRELLKPSGRRCFKG